MSKAKMMGAAFAAMLSLAGVKKAEAHPHHDHGHDAPATSVQASRYEHMARTNAEARPDIDVLFLDFDAYVAVNPDAQARRLRQLQTETRRFNKTLGEIYKKGRFDAASGQYQPNAGLDTLSPQALAVLGGYEQSRQALAENSINLTPDEAAGRYRAQLTELLDTKLSSASKVQTLRQRQAEVNTAFEKTATSYRGDIEGYQNAIRAHDDGELSLLAEHQALADVERTLAGQVEPAVMEHAQIQTVEATREQEFSR